MAASGCGNQLAKVKVGHRGRRQKLPLQLDGGQLETLTARKLESLWLASSAERDLGGGGAASVCVCVCVWCICENEALPSTSPEQTSAFLWASSTPAEGPKVRVGSPQSELPHLVAPKTRNLPRTLLEPLSQRQAGRQAGGEDSHEKEDRSDEEEQRHSYRSTANQTSPAGKAKTGARRSPAFQKLQKTSDPSSQEPRLSRPRTTGEGGRQEQVTKNVYKCPPKA